MQAIKESYLYYLYTLVRGFFPRQWEQSRAVQWLTAQQDPAPGLTAQVTGAVRRVLVRVCKALHLDRLLQGSIFLHPMLFALSLIHI